MSTSSHQKILAQARIMGLELSDDGKSWVPMKELVVKVPISTPVKVVSHHNSLTKKLKMMVFTPIGLAFIMWFVFTLFEQANRLSSNSEDSFGLLLVLLFQMFTGVYFLTPIFFWMRSPQVGNIKSNTTRLEVLQITQKQKSMDENEKNVMAIFESIGVVILFIIILFILYAVWKLLRFIAENPIILEFLSYLI